MNIDVRLRDIIILFFSGIALFLLGVSLEKHLADVKCVLSLLGGIIIGFSIFIGIGILNSQGGDDNDEM